MSDEKDPPDNVVNLDDYRYNDEIEPTSIYMVSAEYLENLEERIRILEQDTVKRFNKLDTLLMLIKGNIEKIIRMMG